MPCTPGLHRPSSPLPSLLLAFVLPWVAPSVDLAAAPAAPVAPAGRVATVDSLVVTASPVVPSLAADPVAVATVLPVGDSGATDLGGLLDAVAGVQMRRYGGVGAPVTVSLRGASPGQLVVLVDGVPLVDAQGGGGDLSRLSLERYDRVEVYRGLVPVGFGGGGGVGAVNLVTRADAPSGWRVRQSVGSFGEAGLRLEGGWRRDGLSTGLLLFGRRADNRFRFLNHLQTLANSDDDFLDRRRNADHERAGAAWRAGWQGPVGRLELQLGAVRQQGGRPGPVGGLESPHARVRYDRYDGRLVLARGPLELLLYGQRDDELLRDPAGEVGWDPPGDTWSRSEQALVRLTAGGALAAPGGRLTWRLGAEGRRQWYRERRADLADPLRTRTGTTLYGAAEWRWEAARLALAPGFRWRRLEDDVPPLPPLPWLPEEPLAAPHVVHRGEPSLGLTWGAVPRRLVLAAHAAWAIRPPTWVELFGHRGGVDGNRELQPEELTSWDVGVAWRPSAAWRARASWFHVDSDRTVVWRQNSQYTSRPLNIGGAVSRGLELEWEFVPAGQWSCRGNLTWQHTAHRGADPVYRGKELPFRPAVQATASVAWRRGPWRAEGRLRSVSRTYRDRYNSEAERVPAHTTWDLSLTRRWDGRHDIALTVELRNLTDVDVYDVEGFPLPGRAWRVVWSIR